MGENRETLKMLIKMYAESIMTKPEIYDWDLCFKQAKNPFGSNKCFGQPSISGIAENVALVPECV